MYVWKKIISKFRWHCISVCSLRAIEIAIPLSAFETLPRKRVDQIDSFDSSILHSDTE